MSTVFKRYISALLLLAFGFLAVPPAISHLLLADHHDTACELHKGNVATIEEPHEHCDVFDIKTPLYNSPQITLFAASANVFLAIINSVLPSFKGKNSFLRLPARAPPAV